MGREREKLKKKGRGPKTKLREKSAEINEPYYYHVPKDMED